MELIRAEWRVDVNKLLIDCDCGHRIRHRADRWGVKCKACGNTANLADLREKYKNKNIGDR